MMARTEAAVPKERLRLSHCPARVRMLFMGEVPPASGRFFNQADSGLYRAIRDAFARAVPLTDKGDFLKRFQMFGCYLVDLCGKRVDRFFDDPSPQTSAMLSLCGRTEVAYCTRYPPKEDRDAIVVSGTERGVTASYDRLSELLVSTRVARIRS
jgi:hypothetical protein